MRECHLAACVVWRVCLCRLREQGLPANGKKEVVAERLAQAMYSALGGSSGAGGSGVAMDGEDWGPTEQAFPAETEELEE